jgi:biopolymer transport protein ExbD
LTTTLIEARKRYADQGVMIRGDAKLSYQDLADVLSACNTAGIRSVKLPVRPREEAGRN